MPVFKNWNEEIQQLVLFFNIVKNVYYTQACLYDYKQSIATHLGFRYWKQAFKIKII